MGQEAAAASMASTLSGMGSALGNGLFNEFGNYQDPGKAAGGWLNQIPGYLNNAFQPWMTGGLNSFHQAQGAYGNMLNPTQLMGQIGSQYKASPGYNWQVNQALGAANRSAAAGGMAGTPAEQQSIAQAVNGMAGNNYYQYMQNALGEYNQGAGGLENQANLGFNAANQYGTDMSQYLMSRGNLAYADAQNQNKKNSSIWGAVGSFL